MSYDVKLFYYIFTQRSVYSHTHTHTQTHTHTHTHTPHPPHTHSQTYTQHLPPISQLLILSNNVVASKVSHMDYNFGKRYEGGQCAPQLFNNVKKKMVTCDW